MSRGKARKGLSQDALRGLAMPEVAGVYPYTGEQSLQPATLGEALVRGLGPTNGLPGVSASLGGGQSPYGIAAEESGGLDLTKKAKKALRRALKNANNGGDLSADEMALIVGAARAANDVQVGGAVKPKYFNKALKKVQRDPVAALSRLELLAGRLRPNDPRRLAAAGLILKCKLVANDTAGSSGSVKKAVASIDPVDVFAALGDVEAALGISSSAAGFSPGQIAGDQQLRSIMVGQPESLRGTQDASALVGGPAAMLGQALKADGLGEELAKAEAEVRQAEVSGNSTRLSTAHQDLTTLKLKAAHRAEGI